MAYLLEWTPMGSVQYNRACYSLDRGNVLIRVPLQGPEQPVDFEAMEPWPRHGYPHL